jgi:hypothetical protein
VSVYGEGHYEKRLKEIQAAQKLSKAGGKARAEVLSSKRKSEIASTAAKARWKNLQANASLTHTSGKHMLAKRINF